MLTECFVRIDHSYLIFFLHQKADEKIRIFSPSATAIFMLTQPPPCSLSLPDVHNHPLTNHRD